uniref:Secreted protein n=1 Tax=Panagrellus redivivus TaxID=6233 RepID=A0A7E4W268_PANRE
MKLWVVCLFLLVVSLHVAAATESKPDFVDTLADSASATVKGAKKLVGSGIDTVHNALSNTFNTIGGWFG